MCETVVFILFWLRFFCLFSERQGSKILIGDRLFFCKCIAHLKINVTSHSQYRLFGVITVA